MKRSKYLLMKDTVSLIAVMNYCLNCELIRILCEISVWVNKSDDDDDDNDLALK